ncbi:MAG: tRNA epoxyqueuosine(34) reductase QueG [Formosimonas sp.]
MHSTYNLREFLRTAAQSLGFSQFSISQPDLGAARQAHLDWLAQGFQGDMAYMERNLEGRFAPAQLVPDALSVISVTLPYLAAELADDWVAQGWQTIATPQQAMVSRYALGRDYHKVVRSRLQKLGEQLAAQIAPTPLIYRAFSDSAPVPEVEIAQQTQLGWRGKHTLLLNRGQGSMFFLGELYVNLNLEPDDAPAASHCGSCSACIDLCPTAAIVAPYRLDARRCISYLTIEYSGVIPHEFRRAIGNRIYGCDDCQLACPWNKFAVKSVLPDFALRNGLAQASLLELLAWNESEFKQRMAGSAIHRIGHAQWQRNILLALGNAPPAAEVEAVLSQFIAHNNPILAEQAQWSLAQQCNPSLK